MRHAENRRVLLQLYPEWDPQMPSGRMSDSLSLSSKNRSDGLLGAAPSSASSMRQRTSMGSSWGSTSSMNMSNKSSYSLTPKIRSRVVVVKYDEKPKLSALFALASRFGAIREHLVLKNKAFLELMTHEEAIAMTSHYQNKPAILHGREVKIYLSKELLVIEKNDRPEREGRNRDSGPVVFFSNLPRETEKKAELLTVARRFGTVVNHLFLNDQAFVQMSNSEDAEMLVKYYTIHTLTINRRTIHMNICTKYKTLTVKPGKGEQLKEDPEECGQKTSSTSRTSSKSSSKLQRSSSSRTKESSYEKAQESKPDDEVQAEAGSVDEGEGVVEAHDEEEEALAENLATEESATAQPDQESTMEFEDSAMDTEKGPFQEGDETEIPEEEPFEDAHKTEQPIEHDKDQEQVDNTELKESEGQDDVEQDDGAADDSLEQEVPEECDFPEDLDEFVTLDELAEDDDAEGVDSRSRDRASSGRSRDSGGLRVVNVVGFKRSYGYLDEILSLAKPFGKVVRHLILHSRPEAFLEFSTEQEARSMVRFYNGNVIPSVCGKTVKIYHSMTYATIQSGKVVYIGHIPVFKGSDSSFLKVAEPFGKVRRYYLNRSRNECFIEMEKGEDAEKFVESARLNPIKFEGKRLLVYISRKYKQLKHGHRPPTTEDKRPAKREHSEEREGSRDGSPVKTSTVQDEEPPTKKAKEEKPGEETTLSAPEEEALLEEEEEKEEKEEKEEEVVDGKAEPCESAAEVSTEHTEEQNSDTTESQNVEIKPPKVEGDTDVPPTEPSSVASSAAVSEKSQEQTEAATTPTESVKKPQTTLDALGLYEPNVPVGVEFVKMGYYCRVCFLFYSNEDTAKKVHCSSQAHYEKLKKHLEKEKAKAQSNRDKN